VGSRVAIVALAALLCAAAQLAAQTPIVVEDWREAGTAGPIPAGWSFYGREAQLKFRPSVVVDEGRRALWLKTEHGSVRLARKTDVDLSQAPVLSWEWKAITLPKQGDVRSEIGDQVARIVLMFPPRYRPRMLGYVWDTHAPVGTEAHTKQTMLDRWLIVVRSGPADVGRWLRETRNVEDDFTRLFGGAPPSPMAVGVESHSEDAAHASEVYIGPITLGR
jgi:hypothetical protein